MGSSFLSYRAFPLIRKKGYSGVRVSSLLLHLGLEMGPFSILIQSLSLYLDLEEFTGDVGVGVNLLLKHKIETLQRDIHERGDMRQTE